MSDYLDSILNFLSPEAGQARRRKLDLALMELIPPEMRPQLGLVAEMNPVVSMERAGTAAGRVANPSLSGWERMAAAGDTLSNMAGVVGPAAVARRVGMPVANAVQETLLGASASAPAVAARDFLSDDFGGVSLFDDWIDSFYTAEARKARSEGRGEPLVKPDIVYRGVSPQELENAVREGVFRANGAGVFVEPDPTRYVGGGAYGAKNQGAILQFDVSGLPKREMTGGLGTGDTLGYDAIPFGRVRMAWLWDPDKKAHVLRPMND